MPRTKTDQCSVCGKAIWAGTGTAAVRVCRDCRSSGVIPYTCTHCGTHFEAPLLPPRKYCSRSCYFKANPKPKGERKPRDRGGRTGHQYNKLREQMKRDGTNVCHLCGNDIDLSIPYPGPQSWSLDHIVPVSRGGDPLEPANCAEAHKICNERKGNRDGPPSNTSSRMY